MKIKLVENYTPHSTIASYEFPHFFHSLLLLTCCFCCASVQGQVIDYSTVVKIEKGKRITEKSFVIQVNNKDQDWLSEIEIPYSSDQEFELLGAYVIDSKGKPARELKNKEITTRSDISYGTFYEDDFIKAFKLSWNEYPYQIKYQYRITDKKFIYVSKWYPVLHQNSPTLNASLRVEFPLDYEVSIDYSTGIRYQKEVIDGKQIHQWELPAYTFTEAEIFSPPVSELMPSVSVIPIFFEYVVKGSSASWSSYGAWHSALNQQLDDLPIAEGVKIKKLVQGVTDKKEIVRILYHYLQDNTRYINVAIDAGGLKPYPASYVSEKKYGDCKALTIYMKALLKEAGIPSFYTIVHAGSNPVSINRDLPSQQFNHVILCVPLDGDTIWLENTANYLPFNYLGTFTQNRDVLLVDGENSRLVKTPALGLEEVLENTNFLFQLEETGSGMVRMTRRLKGKAFEEYLYSKQLLSEKDRKIKIEKDVQLNNAELISEEVIQSNRDQPELDLEVEFWVKDQFRQVGQFRVIQPPLLVIPPFEDPNLRRKPVRVNYPVNQLDSAFYELPFLENYSVELPKNTTIESKYGKYLERYEKKEQQILVIRHFELYRGDYSRELYQDLFSFITAIIKTQKQSAILLTKSR